jgi:deoxyribonuclease IV
MTRKIAVPLRSFMRRVGGHVSIAGGLTNAISNIENIGGNCLQIFAGSPRTWARSLFPEDQVKSFNDQLKEKKLNPVFIHALYLVNLGSDQADLVEKSEQSLLTDMQNGDLINSAGVIVHIGSHQGRGFASVKKQIIASIKKIISQTKTTPFVIENSAGQKGKIGSLEEIRDLVAGINSDRVKVCLDSAHLFAAGLNLKDEKEVDNLVVTLKEYELLDKLALLHLNDSKALCNSGRDIHDNLGQGTIGKEGLINFANHPDFKNLPIILEVPGLDGKGPDSHNINFAKNL